MATQNTETKETVEQAPVAEAVKADAAAKPIKQNPVGAILNRFFHFYDKGTTMKSEIGAGIGMFFIAVCALLMNTQIIGAAYGNYAGPYLAVTLIAFLGTALLGIICNLPLVQTANMATSSVLISMITTNAGLTYSNMMMITFISAIIYLVIAVSPLRKFIADALPDSVKKAMPVAVAVYTIYMALKNTGLLNAAGNIAKSGDYLLNLDKFYFLIPLIGIIVFLVLKALGRKKPFFATFGIMLALMWLGGIIFFMDEFIGGQTATVVVYKRVNLFVATDGAWPYSIALGFQELNLGKLFTEGFDFTAFTEAGGNVLLVVIQGVLAFLGLGVYNNEANLRAVTYNGDFADENGNLKEAGKVHIIGSALNVVSPILGATPTSVGTQSALGVGDGAKTGLASLAAAIGFCVALFSWIFFAFFATGINGVGMWIDDPEVKLAAYVQDTFLFADFMMVLAGCYMLKAVKECNFKDFNEFIPFVAVVGVAAFSGNIALGIAFGVIADAILKLAQRKFDQFKLTNIVMSVLMLVYAVLALL